MGVCEWDVLVRQSHDQLLLSAYWKAVEVVVLWYWAKHGIHSSTHWPTLVKWSWSDWETLRHLYHDDSLAYITFEHHLQRNASRTAFASATDQRH